jgi:predicted 3-demethylubiquinone-9 3-methyltransferase (glyoxalase superfamily)
MKKSPYPCMWFNNNAKQAVDYYCAIFPDSQILSENHMVIQFLLSGTRYMALNGGPQFTFNESISFVIECKDQQEIDYYWESLSKEGEKGRCGWLTDKYGVSWYILHGHVGTLCNNPQTTKYAGNAMMNMKNFIIKDLEK